MSYAGHVIDMINRFKQNRDLIKSRREKVARLRSMYLDFIPYENHHFYEKKIPKEELERIKSGFRKKIIRERRRGMVFSVSLTLLILTLIILFLRRVIETAD